MDARNTDFRARPAHSWRARRRSLRERLGDLWRFLRREAEQRRALQDIAARHHDRWLEDAGLTREEAHRILQRSWLHSVAEWARTRGGGR